jgi:KDO2-lipid IV(A) lauroyltransferase
MGNFLGHIMYMLMPKARQLILENLQQSQLFNDQASLKQTIKQNIIESGKSILETFAIWQKDEKEILSFVKQVDGWEESQTALQSDKGVIFLTPHLGCFEITSIYIGAHYPLAVLFRPPKMQWLLPLIEKGRTRTGITLAEANASGVRKLMQSLKKGEAVGILPDQIPSAGEGEWAPFFDKPAYTMTLASKLANKTGAAVIMVFGERLANGNGYHIHFTPLAEGSIATTTLLNHAIEQQVKRKPSQYLWNYPRYKVRRGAKSQHLAAENIDAN